MPWLVKQNNRRRWKEEKKKKGGRNWLVEWRKMVIKREEEEEGKERKDCGHRLALVFIFLWAAGGLSFLTCLIRFRGMWRRLVVVAVLLLLKRRVSVSRQRDGCSTAWRGHQRVGRMGGGGRDSGGRVEFTHTVTSSSWKTGRSWLLLQSVPEGSITAIAGASDAA